MTLTLMGCSAEMATAAAAAALSLEERRKRRRERPPHLPSSRNQFQLHSLLFWGGRRGRERVTTIVKKEKSLGRKKIVSQSYFLSPENRVGCSKKGKEKSSSFCSRFSPWESSISDACLLRRLGKCGTDVQGEGGGGGRGGGRGGGTGGGGGGE